METFSALLAFCAGNSPVAGKFPSKGPVAPSFGVFFDLGLNKRLSKQSRGWWFATPSRPLWRHCNNFPKSGRIQSVGPYGTMENDQHWFEQWLDALRRIIIPWTNVDWSSVGASGAQLMAILQKMLDIWNEFEGYITWNNISEILWGHMKSPGALLWTSFF